MDILMISHARREFERAIKEDIYHIAITTYTANKQNRKISTNVWFKGLTDEVILEVVSSLDILKINLPGL